MSFQPKLLDRITVQDIEASYDFKNLKNDLILELGLNTSFQKIVDNYSFEYGDHVEYRFDILLKNNESILEFSCTRQLFPCRQLWSKINTKDLDLFGRVAFNAQLSIRASFQKKGIASLIYKLEDQLFRKWGAVEIQMVAANRGKEVWRGFGFVLHCDDIGLVDYFYQEWCQENGIVYATITDIMLYPASFLLWDKIKNIRMYKILL